MGADLYSKRFDHEAELPYEQKYSEQRGYFRDSYNSTSVMAAMGLSWWKDVVPMLTSGERGVDVLTEEACERLAQRLDVAEFAPDQPEIEYMRDKRLRLIRFLREESTHGPIEASL